MIHLGAVSLQLNWLWLRLVPTRTQRSEYQRQLLWMQISLDHRSLAKHSQEMESIFLKGGRGGGN